MWPSENYASLQNKERSTFIFWSPLWAVIAFLGLNTSLHILQLKVSFFFSFKPEKIVKKILVL